MPTSTPRRPPKLSDAALAATILWGPLLYPAWLAVRTRIRPLASVTLTDPWPDVSVIVPAYLEADVIAAKVAGVRAQDYPGTVEVLVVADDRGTADAARAAQATVVEPGRRMGKSGALNLGVEAAKHEVIVLTDANAMLADGALSALVEPLRDPTIMAVAGEKRVADAAEGVYWRFESWLKRKEASTGTTIGLVGELAAVRRRVWRPLPVDVAVDDLWIALDVIENGGRIAYAPEASTIEEAGEGLRSQWERRTRVVSGTLDVLWRRRALLRPGSRVADQLWGHRLVRSSVGPLAHVVLLLRALRASRTSPVARLFLLGHIGAAVALLRSARGADLSAPERLAAQVLFLQAVGVGGVVRYARRERLAKWPKVSRSTGRVASNDSA
jgi:poly-beta-1,6-N-acetyl-D-glucosamine synthase